MINVNSVSWPTTTAEAIALQLQLRTQVRLSLPAGFIARTAAGLDVAYAENSTRVVGAVVVLDMASLTVLDQATAWGTVTFPYAPGLFAFRELPVLIAALTQLTTTPDVLVCDGNGIAHPRRFGLASHLGVLSDIPTFGVAKTSASKYVQPDQHRGAWSALQLDNEIVGRVLRTQKSIKPVFVSIGHDIDLATACQLTLQLSTKYRLPETTRLADRLARTTLLDSNF